MLPLMDALLRLPRQTRQRTTDTQAIRSAKKINTPTNREATVKTKSLFSTAPHNIATIIVL